MNAVVSVIGKDRVGILARVSTECANANVNVLEVTQTLLQDTFAMTMLGLGCLAARYPRHLTIQPRALWRRFFLLCRYCSP